MKAAKNYLEAAFWWALLLSAFFGWVIYAIVVSAH
jgi:ABC-type microcin C transport system permease subunit YejE